MTIFIGKQKRMIPFLVLGPTDLQAEGSMIRLSFLSIVIFLICCGCVCVVLRGSTKRHNEVTLGGQYNPENSRKYVL